MGEEEKKVEEGGEKEEGKNQDGGEKKPEEGASAGKEEKKDGDGGEKKQELEKDTSTPPPPPPEEIVIRVFMHCEGCARKVRRALRGFEGVEDVKTDCKTHKVFVKGKVAAADPLKVVERIQKKTGRKVELLTPIPPKPEKKEEKKEVEKEKEKPKEEKKEEPPVIAVVLKVHMHCEACSQEIKKRILKMKGVEEADPDLKASQVMVKGVFDPPKLVEYVYKRTGKHAIIVKQEAVEKKAGDDDKEVKAAEAGAAGGEKGDKVAPAGGDGEKNGGGEEEKKKEGGGADDPANTAATSTAAAAASTAAKLVEVMNRNELNYYYPRYPLQYAYPPQIFSDENPNACSLM